MSITLLDSGYSVETAADGAAGIRLCRQNPPQIVITDIRMPEIGGLDVLKTVKEIDPRIEVVVITAFAEMDLAIQALQLDASDFITKPVHDQALHLALDRAKQRYTARQKIQDYMRLLEKENANQARILHQDKMMSLGRLAASVVHEINNPLSGILNYSKLMLRILESGSLTPERRQKFIRHLEMIRNESDRCSKIVSGLLAFSRKSPPAFTHVKVSELLERSISLSRHKLELQDIQLSLRLADDLPDIEGDFNQLQQCVINLLFNAMDAMPAGGTIELEAQTEPAKGRLIISVADRGSGIPPENMASIFEPFFTTKQEGHGVGLGLSTVFGIMEQHKGSVEARNRSGGGAVFMLKLPLR
jgi:signal transduction histidine kinase